MNESKTSFFVTHGTLEENEPLHISGFVMEGCTPYSSIGSPFTADRSVFSSPKAHGDVKMAQVNTFISFLRKNDYIGIPFCYVQELESSPVDATIAKLYN